MYITENTSIMTKEEILHKFYEIVRPNGKTASSRFSESYFRNHGHGDLYDEIRNRTSFLLNDPHILERVTALRENLTEHPKCVTCGSPVMFVNRKSISKYCSKQCSHRDPNLSQKRKDSSKKVDYKKAAVKRKSTMLEKYGVEYNSQREDIKEVLAESKIKHSNPNALSRLESYEWMRGEYITNKRTLVDIADELSVYYGTVGEYCRKHGFEIRQQTNYSQHEKEIGSFVDSLGLSYTSDRKILGGYEIDILIEDKKIGIELDGVYWHSYNRFESKEEKNKHLTKTILAKERGVKLMHVFDTEWIHKRPIIESMIRNRVGMSDTIYARKCEIREITPQEAKSFLNTNHIQGHTGARVNLGLFRQDQLVMVMTFGKPRFSKNSEWELIRLGSLLNLNIVGGSSKLFNHFLKNFYNGGGIICYSDRRFGEGDVYTKLGFEKRKSTPPGYYWTDGEVVWSRTRFQKNKLNKLLKDFDSSLSEAENMFKNKYRRLWDCGNSVFLYK